MPDLEVSRWTDSICAFGGRNIGPEQLIRQGHHLPSRTVQVEVAGIWTGARDRPVRLQQDGQNPSLAVFHLTDTARFISFVISVTH